MQGFQTKKAYRMSRLDFQWKTTGGGTAYAVVSSQPGTVPNVADSLPPSASIVGKAESTENMYDFRTVSISSDSSQLPLYVGFYAGVRTTLELLTARILKKQYDFPL